MENENKPSVKFTEVKVDISKKDDLLGIPLHVISVKEQKTANGLANLITANKIADNKEVNFFMSTDRSSPANVNKNYILKTAVSKNGRTYFYLQEIVIG